MPALHVIYASTSGHTEYVLETLVSALKKDMSELSVSLVRAELATPEDFTKGDILLLASSTWNTGGAEGQLNPHMHLLLKERAEDVSLNGKKVLVIGLGDTRYRYTCKAADHLEDFVKIHGGVLLGTTLRFINEPYGQEETVQKWAATLPPLLA